MPSYSGTTSYYYYDETYSGSSSSSFGNATELWPLYIPVLGPWIEMGFLHGSGAPLGGALLAFDGLVQAGGLAMLIAGAVTRTKVAIYAFGGYETPGDVDIGEPDWGAARLGSSDWQNIAHMPSLLAGHSSIPNREFTGRKCLPTRRVSTSCR